MGFTGSINQDLRAMLAELAPSWRGRPLYVGCSGNFNVERIAAKAGVEEIHGCDVSLYSCALGGHLAGRDIDITIKDDRYRWLEPFMAPGAPVIATLLLAMEYFKFTDRLEPFHLRMERAYRTGWADLHRRSVEKVSRGIEGLALRSFTAADVVDFVQAAPDDAVVVSFPPTYAKGYERLYKKIDEVFGWNAPTYQVFDDLRFQQFLDALQGKAAWVTLKDAEVPSLAPHLIGHTQASVSSKPVYVYASHGTPRVTSFRQRIDPVPFPRLRGDIVGPLKLVRLTAGQLNTLRSEYLNPGITPVGAQVQVGICTATNELVGVLAFMSDHVLSGHHDAYMVSDFPVAPTPYRRLSKLIVAIALSTEVKVVLEQLLNKRVRMIGTNAFTKKPVSMKYRGLLELHSRRVGHATKPDALYYIGPTGKWSMAEAFAWWQAHHGDRA
ncbi:MAG: hypothetical protein AB7K63_17345 [Vicinamibacterales bacterium]